MAEHPSLTPLVPRILAGDQGALTELVDGALGRLVAVARRAGASPEDAEEIASDAIYRTFVRLSSLNLSMGRSKDPLFAYMAKAALQGARQRHRDGLAEQTAMAQALNVEGGAVLLLEDVERSGPVKPFWSNNPPGSDGTERKEVEQLHQFLATLDESDQLIAGISSWGGWTSKEIAEEIGMNAPAVRQRWSRLLVKFSQWYATLERTE